MIVAELAASFLIGVGGAVAGWLWRAHRARPISTARHAQIDRFVELHAVDDARPSR
jgi:uncharacterized membrane protein